MMGKLTGASILTRPRYGVQSMGWSIIAGRQMFRQIHAVMQQAKDVDALAFWRLEDNEVAASSAKSRHRQGANYGADIVPLSGPQTRWRRCLSSSCTACLITARSNDISALTRHWEGFEFQT